MATKQQQWENALLSEHKNPPAPFNPEYNQDAVDRYNQFKKEKSAYAATIDTDDLSDDDFSIAMQIKEDELVLKYKIEFLMSPTLFVKAQSYAAFTSPVEISKNSEVELSFARKMMHDLKGTAQAYPTPKRIKQFLKGKDLKDELIITVGEALVVLNEDKKTGIAYYAGEDIATCLERAEAVIARTLGNDEPIFENGNERKPVELFKI